MDPIIEETDPCKEVYYSAQENQRGHGSPPSAKDDATVFLRRLWWVIACSDTLPTRFMLSFAASMWAIFLALPGDTMERPAFIYLSQTMGEYAELKWTAVWAVVATLSWLNVFLDHRFTWLAYIVNASMCLLFIVYCLGIYLARPYPAFPVAAGLASDVACVFAAAWVLVRTRVNGGPGWRHD